MNALTGPIRRDGYARLQIPTRTLHSCRTARKGINLDGLRSPSDVAANMTVRPEDRTSAGPVVRSSAGPTSRSENSLLLCSRPFQSH